MESRSFIKEVANVIREIDDFELAKSMGVATDASTGPDLQKRVSQLFSSLQNPTLPSAYKLRDKALDVGMYVDQRVLQRLSQYEFLS